MNYNSWLTLAFFIFVLAWLVFMAWSGADIWNGEGL